jgi:hypothetical protein
MHTYFEENIGEKWLFSVILSRRDYFQNKDTFFAAFF